MWQGNIFYVLRVLSVRCSNPLLRRIGVTYPKLTQPKSDDSNDGDYRRETLYLYGVGKTAFVLRPYY